MTQAATQEKTAAGQEAKKSSFTTRVKNFIDNPVKKLKDPLFQAIHTGNARDVKLLLEAKASPNKRKYAPYPDSSNHYFNNFTPLLAAIVEGRNEIVNILIQNKADVNLKKHSVYISAGMSSKGYSNFGEIRPIHIAAAEGRLDIIQTLIANKAKLSERTVDPFTRGDNALEVAQKTQHLHRDRGVCDFLKAALALEKSQQSITAPAAPVTQAATAAAPAPAAASPATSTSSFFHGFSSVLNFRSQNSNLAQKPLLKTPRSDDSDDDLSKDATGAHSPQ